MGIHVTTAWAEENDAEFPVGLLVEGLASNSAYEDAGGQINDVITEFEGTTITSRDQLLADLRRYRAGDLVEVRILRADERELLLQVELGSLDG